MLPPEEVLSSLLGSLYDAAADPSLWESFLQQLTQSARAQCADMLMHDMRQQSHTISRYWMIDPEDIRLYNEHYGSKDVWVSGGSAAPIGWTGTSEELCPPDAFSKSEFYNEFLLPHENVGHAMFGIIEKSEIGFANISILRAASAKPFGQEELHLLQFLIPHIQRAYLLHFQISALKSRNKSLQTALDMIPTAMVLLDSKGAIVAMNQAASRLAIVNDGLLATRNGLRAERSGESAQLEKLIAEAIATSTGEGLSPAGAVLISRKKGVSLQVLVTPVRNVLFDTIRSVCAIAFINDPAQRIRPAQDVLKMLFGLTPAECRVSLLLADGRAPGEIADILDVTANTLKSHLSSVYSKTDTSRQSQLVRLLVKLALGSEPRQKRTVV
jgi:DNA-binding CsgD family transcriptional regulator